MTVGQRLRAARELAGISAKDLDRLAGNSEGHQWVLEKLEEATAVAKTLDGVCTVLGLSLDYVVRGQGRKPTKKTVSAAVAAARINAQARVA